MPYCLSDRQDMPPTEGQSEWLTRKKLIDPILDSLGWVKTARPRPTGYRIEEYEGGYAGGCSQLFTGGRRGVR